MSRFDWMEYALCAQTDPDLFHVDGSGGTYNTAKKVCATCPVTRQCADFAQAVEGDVSYGWRHGLWGAQLPKARAKNGGAVKRAETHEAILRLTARGGLDPYQIAEHVGVDVRTVFRVTKKHRDQLGEAA